MSQTENQLVGIITIWYQTIDRIEAFVRNLKALEYQNIRLVFVFNQLTPEEIKAIQNQMPGVHLINSQINLGTTGGWNLGIQYLLSQGCDYIGIWNVDVQLAPDCISVLINILENNSDIGAAGPILFYSDEPDKVQMYGGSIDPNSLKCNHRNQGTTNLANLALVQISDYLDGGTIFVRASIFSKIGGFDESLFMYYEDVDICFRIQKMGLHTVAVREAHAWHFHRQDKGRFPPSYEIYYITRNRFQILRKYRYGLRKINTILHLLHEMPRVLFFFLRKKKLGLVRAYLLGTWAGFIHETGKVSWII